MPDGAKGVLLKSKFPSIIVCPEKSCYVLKYWACSTWYVIALGVYPIGALVTDCQFHLDLRQNDSVISVYPSLTHLFYACQVVTIGNIYDFFCQRFLMFCRSHCLASGFWVETLVLLGNCAVWSRLSEFCVQSNSWRNLLIFHFQHSNTGGRHTFPLYLISREPTYLVILEASCFSMSVNTRRVVSVL